MTPETKTQPEGREQRILEIIETTRKKRPRFKDERVTMAHGAGGKATQTMIEGLFAPAFGSEQLQELGDSGIVNIELRPAANPDTPGGEAEEVAGSDSREVAGSGSVAGFALTTDTFVVRPLQFPGGSIGELAVNGTVNDLAAAGAKPLAITLGLVLEEGLDAAVLRAEVGAVAEAAAAAGVEVVSGDTKVVERGHADGMYVNTSGLGRVDARAQLSTRSIEAGDKVLVSGTIGEHGTAIMLVRGELGLEADVVSDTRSLWPVADALMGSAGASLRCMRDATRGGVATVLNELARASAVGVTVREADVPVRPDVAGACELLGIDPMYVANEGVMVAFVAPEAAADALTAMRALPGHEAAVELGEVRAEPPGMVLVETAFGGKRVMDLLAGDPLPRIC